MKATQKSNKLSPGIMLSDVTWHELDDETKIKLLITTDSQISAMKDFSELSPQLQKRLIIAYRQLKTGDEE